MENILDQYQTIGWDFDGVLVNDINSNLFQQYIKEHPEKKHYIVTFRTHEIRDQIWNDLEMSDIGLTQRNFVNVFSIPVEAWIQFTTLDYARKVRKDYTSPLTEPELFYIEWKGMTCKQHNIPVLIDDLTNHVLPGCKKYGITLFHPNDLL